MTKEKLEKLKKLLEITNEGLTEKRFLESFKKVIDHILKLEIKLIKKIDAFIQSSSEKLKELISKTEVDIEGIKGQLAKDADKMFEEQRQNLDFIRDKVRRIKVGSDGSTPKKGIDYFDGDKGEPGRDADEEKIVKEVLKSIIIPDHAKELKELEDKLMEEIKRNKRLGGGGTSAIGIANAAKYWVKTEAPSGVIDGANTTYTVKQTIFAVFGFTLNGESIAQIPNYTISGKTITFSSALPAAYSGKDFEITYV